MSISTTPQAVWYGGSVIVSSGSIIAKSGRFLSLLSPRLTPSAVFVSTALSLVSLPVAAIVSTTPTGRLSDGSARCSV